MTAASNEVELLHAGRARVARERLKAMGLIRPKQEKEKEKEKDQLQSRPLVPVIG